MANSQQIEDRIDREKAGAIALHQTARAFSIAPNSMSDLMEFAKMMAISGECIPKPFREKPGACLAIALQAFRTGADPFAVANKAYLVNDRVAYEAQYIHAVINTSGLLKKRLRATYDGEGQALRCTVRGEIHGEDEPFEYRSPTVAAIPVKNSPLWKGDPEQQLFYYASRAWARRYAPEVILGMDTGEDIESHAIDVTPPPKPRREDFVAPEPQPTFVVINGAAEEEEFEHAPDAVERAMSLLSSGARLSETMLETVFDNNDRLMRDLADAGKPHLAREIEAYYRELVDELRATADSPPQAAGEAQDHPPDLSPASPASHPDDSAKEVVPNSEPSPDERAKHNETAPVNDAGAAPTDIVGQLGRKLTEAAQQGPRALDKAWLTLSEHERDLARPMRAQYREIAAAQVRP